MQHICRNKGLTSLGSTEKHDDVAVTCFLLGLVILFFVYHTAQLRNSSVNTLCKNAHWTTVRGHAS